MSSYFMIKDGLFIIIYQVPSRSPKKCFSPTQKNPPISTDKGKETYLATRIGRVSQLAIYRRGR